MALDMEQLAIPLGLCECGCGNPAPIAKMNRPKIGHVKGQPVRFINGHQGKFGPDWKYVDMGYKSPCRIWQRFVSKDGYGRGRAGGRGKKLTHVLAWEAVNGSVPVGLELDHLCRVRACGEVSHLEAVTRPVNIHRSNSAKLTAEQAREIATSTKTRRTLATEYGVSMAAIKAVRSGRNWPSVTGIVRAAQRAQILNGEP